MSDNLVLALLSYPLWQITFSITQENKKNKHSWKEFLEGTLMGYTWLQNFITLQHFDRTIANLRRTSIFLNIKATFYYKLLWKQRINFMHQICSITIFSSASKHKKNVIQNIQSF